MLENSAITKIKQAEEKAQSIRSYALEESRQAIRDVEQDAAVMKDDRLRRGRIDARQSIENAQMQARQEAIKTKNIKLKKDDETLKSVQSKMVEAVSYIANNLIESIS